MSEKQILDEWKKFQEITRDKLSKNYKSQGVKNCPLCKQRNPYDRIDNSEYSATICLRCGKDNNPKSKTYGQTR